MGIRWSYLNIKKFIRIILTYFFDLTFWQRRPLIDVNSGRCCHSCRGPAPICRNVCRSQARTVRRQLPCVLLQLVIECLQRLVEIITQITALELFIHAIDILLALIAIIVQLFLCVVIASHQLHVLFCNAIATTWRRPDITCARWSDKAVECDDEEG